MVELPRISTSAAAIAWTGWPTTRCLRPGPARFGRTDPEASYRRFVAAGLTTPPASPWAEARHGWLLGSERFLDRLRRSFASAIKPIATCAGTGGNLRGRESFSQGDGSQ